MEKPKMETAVTVRPLRPSGVQAAARTIRITVPAMDKSAPMPCVIEFAISSLSR